MSPLLSSTVLKPCDGHGSTGRFYDNLGGATLNTIQQLDEVKRVSWFTSSATDLKLKSGSERSDTIQVADLLLLAQGACGKHGNQSYILALKLYKWCYQRKLTRSPKATDNRQGSFTIVLVMKIVDVQHSFKPETNTKKTQKP